MNDFFKLISGELREEISRRMALDVEVNRQRWESHAMEIESLRARIIELERGTLLEKPHSHQ